jgi:hypothetical protein
MGINKARAHRLYGLENLTGRSRVQTILFASYDTHAARGCQVGSHTILSHRERSPGWPIADLRERFVIGLDG